MAVVQPLVSSRASYSTPAKIRALRYLLRKTRHSFVNGN